MKLGVLGSGGREHALQWCLARSPLVEHVHCLPGNGGTALNTPVDPSNPDAVAAACRELSLDLLVVGPEAPLASGLVDRMTEEPTRVFGPTQAAAQLESSKLWAKAFMTRHGIPTAPHVVIEGLSDARAAFDRFGGAVLKIDGLAAGKGVVVCRERDSLVDAWKQVRARASEDERVLAEAPLNGWELSVLVITDGETWRAFPPSQDHKPLLDGDRGPNTGGMGAFCPAPACTPELSHDIASHIIEPTLAGLRRDGIPYTGFLYFGLMITDDGPQLLEYNVRLGDPEAQVILPALESDLAEGLVACLDGRLDKVELRCSDAFYVDVVLASDGYPDAVTTGLPISGLERAEDACVFHAGTRWDGETLVTAGGRVLNVVGSGSSLEEAIERTYAAVDLVGFEGAVFRRDIGRRGDPV